MMVSRFCAVRSLLFSTLKKWSMFARAMYLSITLPPLRLCTSPFEGKFSTPHGRGAGHKRLIRHRKGCLTIYAAPIPGGRKIWPNIGAAHAARGTVEPWQRPLADLSRFMVGAQGIEPWTSPV